MIGLPSHDCTVSMAASSIVFTNPESGRVRDDACGIEPTVLEAAGRDAHWGITGMHARARRIGAQLTLRQRGTGRTELMLQVPSIRAYALPMRQ
ncbi:hypothetical protein ACLIJR_18030 [Hydrogenophaga sp. XSHU_21]